MAMVARAASLALCALPALCLAPHAVSRTSRGAAAALEGSSSSAVSSEHGHGFPCGNIISIRVPHDGLCDRDCCGGLCVEKYMWKYPDIKAVIGDCTADNTRQCICSFLC